MIVVINQSINQSIKLNSLFIAIALSAIIIVVMMISIEFPIKNKHW